MKLIGELTIDMLPDAERTHILCKKVTREYVAKMVERGWLQSFVTGSAQSIALEKDIGRVGLTTHAEVKLKLDEECILARIGRRWEDGVELPVGSHIEYYFIRVS